ncbi:hypothetical protein [Methylobacterium brachythecii]|uniref:Uncharacterized protein n=1 Tax=Methylobacterium brachythecii TaxID=1176177 RepID=A0A7W6AKH5_9HYPH|nr:hypothetical protein [Methylobacterium brachythecii]MBB3905112.1 hypothetical protein [Methylobacterium brachythecii]GLS44379.1 hypothetical protein GCM10007884_23670 [Methylobacterium brachythecii]
MTRPAVARLLAGLNVQRGAPTAEQWVDALGLVANAERVPGRWLCLEFTSGGSARISEVPLPDEEHA